MTCHFKEFPFEKMIALRQSTELYQILTRLERRARRWLPPPGATAAQICSLQMRQYEMLETQVRRQSGEKENVSERIRILTVRMLATPAGLLRVPTRLACSTLGVHMQQTAKKL